MQGPPTTSARWPRLPAAPVTCTPRALTRVTRSASCRPISFWKPWVIVSVITFVSWACVSELLLFVKGCAALIKKSTCDWNDESNQLAWVCPYRLGIRLRG